MTTSEPALTETATSETLASSGRTWPAVLTWQSQETPRMESVRVQLNGKRIKAAGRIIGGACADHPAFSASYDLVTDENGITKRLSMRSAVAGSDRQTSMSRDTEGYWRIENSTGQRSTYAGALDVDVVLSPFFNALPIRRLGLHTGTQEVQVPVVYVSLPDLVITEAALTYSSGPDGMHVISPVSSSSIVVDADGFVLDYPGLATRI